MSSQPLYYYAEADPGPGGLPPVMTQPQFFFSLTHTTEVYSASPVEALEPYTFATFNSRGEAFFTCIITEKDINGATIGGKVYESQVPQFPTKDALNDFYLYCRDLYGQGIYSYQ